MTIWERLADLISRRPLVTLLGSLLVAAGALWPASRLKIEPQLESLFPDTAAARDYRLFLERFGGLEKVFVVLALDAKHPPDGERLAEAADLLAAALGQSGEVAAARAGISNADERFFLDEVVRRAPLLIDDVDRAALTARLTPSAVSARVRELRLAAQNPASSFTSSLLLADPLGLAGSILARRSGPSAQMVDELTGAFVTKDGRAALVIVTPARSEIDPEGGRALAAAIAAAERATRTETSLPFTLHAVGGPLYAAHDEALIRADLSTMTAGGIVGVGLLLIVGLEGLLLPTIGMLALGLGLIWTVATIGLALGAVTAVAIGFIATLVGMGDDIWIHGCVRFQEEITHHRQPREALRATFRQLAPSILSATMTTVVAFVALAFAHFRPLRELGVATALGLVLILLSSAVAGGALLTLFGARVQRRAPGSRLRFLDRWLDRLIAVGAEHHRAVWLAVVVLSLFGVVGVTRLRLDSDPRALRPTDTELTQSETLVHERFAVGLETTTFVIPAPTLGEALERAGAIRSALQSNLPAGAELFSPSDFLLTPSETARRLTQLRALPLERALVQFEHELPAAGFDLARFAPSLRTLHQLARGEDPGLPDAVSWPDWLQETIRSAPAGATAAVHLRLPVGEWTNGPPDALIERIKAIAPGSAVASIPWVGRELRDVAVADFLRLGSIAAVLIGVVIVISFRGQWRSVALGVLPVLLSSLWVFGLWGWLGRPLDLLCVLVFPVILGVGIDDGLHVVHGAHLDPTRGIVGSAREAARGITIANLTTIVGFSSLIGSRIPGLRNSGLLIGVGLSFCVLTSLVVLPALDRKRR